MMKQNRHTIMAKGIMVLLALLILVFIFTYAWFVNPDRPATANGLTLNTSTEVNYEVAIGFESPYTAGHYVITDFMSGGSINFEDITIPRTVNVSDHVTIRNETVGEHINLFEDFNAVDLTGDGFKLYRPEMRDNNRYIDYDKTRVDYNITDNLQYIAFDIYVRSDSSTMNVGISDGSYVLAACELEDAALETLKSDITNGRVTVSADAIDPSKLKTNVTYRKSKYGVEALNEENFSEDSVIGAVRTSFIQYKNCPNLSTLFTEPETLVEGESYQAGDYQLDSETVKLWIPRSDVYLQDTTKSAEDDWTLKTAADSGNTFDGSVTFNDSVMGVVYGNVTYRQAAKLHRYYDDAKIRLTPYSDRYSSVNNPFTDLSTQNLTAINATNLSDTVEGVTNYFGKCRVQVWIEGCDAEARRAIDGGSFLFGLELKSFN